jgi:hypothetical protein
MTFFSYKKVFNKSLSAGITDDELIINNRKLLTKIYKKMRKLLNLKSLLLLAVILMLPAASLFAQAQTQVAPVSLYQGVQGDLGVNCVGGLIYDDNTWENGYGWNAGYGIGKWVMLMTPTSYPFTINQVCLSMTRLAAGSANWTFDIVVYDNTGAGGAPGNLITTIASQTAVNVPIWPTVGWFDFTGITTIPSLASGSYYVGISYDPATMPSHFIGADESAGTPLRPGYGYIQSAWGTIQSYFATYKAIGIRCDGSGVTYAHNIAVGPFLSLPVSFNSGLQYAIKAKISNLGTAPETAIPIKFFVNGTQTNSTTLNLIAGAVDSVSFNWIPADTGNYNLAIVSALSNDEYRANDTVKTTIHADPPGTVNICIGTGTTAVGYPYYTFYMDSRTDMLYLSSELGTGGWPGIIRRIGFNVTAAFPQVMNGFNIKMQNTTSTSITTFASSGWTTAFSGTYSVPGTGWQFIDLTTPFNYDGTNLIVEICFDNAAYTSNSTVNSSAQTNRLVHAHNDLPSGNGCTDLVTPTTGTLPNMCVKITDILVGTPKINSDIPKVYSLSQNYPNPFNPTTVINYSIPKTSMVKISVFDILGREVMTLVNDTKQPGNYNVEFDASNLASGVYIYKLQSGDFTDTKKMLLIK